MTVSVNRLILHVPAMSEQDAKRLAALIAEAFGDWPTAPTASGRIAGLSVTATATPPATGKADAPVTPESLAASIAQAVFAAALRESI